jgi:6-phosphogluconolactonase
MDQSTVKILNSYHEIAEFLLLFLSNTVSPDGTYHLCLSGGSTPRSIFSLISERRTPVIHWDNVCFYWGDERFVPPDHPESNYKMAEESLFSTIGIRKDRICRIKGENNPDVERKRYEKLVKSRTKGVFDLVLLGLGTDGHTASIFPDQMHLLRSKELYECAIHPDTGQIRLTLTGQVIKAAKQVIFLVTGGDKSPVLHKILSKSGNWRNYPASYIYPESKNLIWLLDRKAGSML